MEPKSSRTANNSRIINGIALGFSLAFLAASAAAAVYTGELGSVFHGWYMIMISPCPLVTDYFAVGGLASALLNAGACGLACFAFMLLLKGESRANTLAGYFLVVAHCFYGLNFLNMWPCFLAPFLYLDDKGLNFKKNLHICMFSTSFAPFISEFLFRYPSDTEYVFGQLQIPPYGAVLALFFSILLGYTVPIILPGAQAWHKGYNLYNGGLAFGLFGFFLYNLLYETFGVPAAESITRGNPIYESFGRNYIHFSTVCLLSVFLICILAGWILNGRTFRGYGALLKDTGYASDFAEKYGMPVCLINIGCNGTLFLLYIKIITYITEGAGFTGPTLGVILAALTFNAMGQHPRNVWPIILGYQLLYLVTLLSCTIHGREVAWSISTQAYINGAAFATGLCPVAGRYGVRAGMAAGFICAAMCTATGGLHGGLVLYNGGFTAGIAALILLPMLEHYMPAVRKEIKDRHIDWHAMITLVGNEDEL